jgi:zinc/manganese transport system permease protein|tara:strand:+ start:1941 stop:2747 length:807 start_codon:yes stop_codon:yes gene_type:complete
MIELIFWPLLAAFVLTGIHVYLGLQVVMRGVIFVDLALAQVAALGSAVGIVMGLDHDSSMSYLLALGFTFMGSALFAYVRSSKQKIPQEAIIGITYVVCAAAMILLFSKSAEGSEHLNHLLVGSILFVAPETIGLTAILYAVIGTFHWKYRQQFLLVSQFHVVGEKLGQSARYWDFLFYVTLGFVVTNSVKIAGVLLVFSFLIIPTVAAIIYQDSIRGRLIFGWVFSIVGSLLGMFVSLTLDVPTGAAIVVTFGAMLAISGIYKVITR